MKASGRKSHAELVKAWDELALERHRQISLGLDVSFSKVIVPTAVGLFAETDGRVVVDVGSGTGEFTERLAGVSDYVIGVEPSRRSTAIAREVCGARGQRGVRGGAVGRGGGRAEGAWRHGGEWR